MQAQSDEEEITQKQLYCKPGSQVQENEDKSTTGFEMEDNFVSIQNEDQDHTNTSVHKDDNADGKQKGQVISKRQTEKLKFSCGVLTRILIKKTDMHLYTINCSRTNMFMQHRYY